MSMIEADGKDSSTIVVIWSILLQGEFRYRINNRHLKQNIVMLNKFDHITYVFDIIYIRG